ncbi:MAG: cytidine deaminase [Wenzhouxiangellaceae bacterium]|jgi:cytidine deaminase|nr:cytidine deaminase [Wenzhouxiangellaceae bacterium]MBS3745970.1 cytidine deaminase [Wenzhouxiangellaceae bacterium]MBS3822332.1 cytidine deaminase [Wenzhouxiangellaceae bacterium]
MSDVEPAVLEALLRARKAAYAPYSNFRVAAVAVAVDGRAHPGCNVETAHYKSICAEASAISAMVGAGQRELASIYVLGPEGRACSPCGDCRQRIREFAGPDTRIVLVDAAGRVLEQFSVDELLPYAFGPDSPGKP